MIKTVVIHLILLGLLVFDSYAQQRFSVSGAARSYVESNALNNADTLNADRYVTGYTMVDLGFDIRPNTTTEIHAQMRMYGPYGGYYGDGASLISRQLYVRGIIGKFLKYHLGDLNLQLTPYTFYNTMGDGKVNEASSFAMLRELAEYDNFNQGNTWRQQGLMTEMKLAIPKVADSIKYKGYIGRNRASDLIDRTDIMQTALSLKYYKGLLYAGLNYANLFSIGKIVNDSATFVNQVVTTDWGLKLDKPSYLAHFQFELGSSLLSFKNYKPTEVKAQDYFYDLGGNVKIKKFGISLGLNFREVGPDFYSAAAQTKRNRYDNRPDRFSSVTNYGINRDITLFDILRNNNVLGNSATNPSLYNNSIAPQLMLFNPSLNNTSPYGVATPNRRAITFNLGFNDKDNILQANLKYTKAMEVQGIGTSQLRNFNLYAAVVNYGLGRTLGWQKIFNLSAGYQYETTNRDGFKSEVIRLNSSLLDLGTDLEVLPGFDILLGLKQLKSTGNEYLAVRDNTNIISTYKAYQTDMTQNTYAAGIRYRFTGFSYLSLQSQWLDVSYSTPSFSVPDAKVYPTYSYGIQQVFILFNFQY